jgi:hypothetical protein
MYSRAAGSISSFYMASAKRFFDKLDLNIHDLLDVGLAEWIEDDHFVNAVQKFRAEAVRAALPSLFRDNPLLLASPALFGTESDAGHGL